MSYVPVKKKKTVDKTHPPGWSKPVHPLRNAREVREYGKTLAGFFAEMQLILERAAKTLESIDDQEAQIKPSTAGIEASLADAKEKLIAAFEVKAEKASIEFQARKKVRELRERTKKD